MSRREKYWRTLRNSGRTKWAGKLTNLSSAGRNIAVTSSASSMRTNRSPATTSGKEDIGLLADITYAAQFRPMIERDERRWEKADGDRDGFLNKIEFQSFLHPEDHPDMVDIVVLETLEDMDQDKDGGISEAEYIRDIYTVRRRGEIRC